MKVRLHVLKLKHSWTHHKQDNLMRLKSITSAQLAYPTPEPAEYAGPLWVMITRWARAPVGQIVKPQLFIRVILL